MERMIHADERRDAPRLGESITEGTITRWRKKPGDIVEKDEVLFEISTDKVDAEILSTAAGVLSEIKIVEDATVEVNVVVAIIADAANFPEVPPVSASEPVVGVAAPAPKQAEPENQTRNRNAIHCSPRVPRLAREKNLDLLKIPAAGLGGRITKENVLVYLSRQGTGASAVSATTPREDRAHVAH